MKQVLQFFVGFLLMITTVTLQADPQYYNFNNGTLNNSFPFNQAAGKMIQTLIAPGEFASPGPAPNGNITSFSVYISALYPLTTTTYTTFRILFLDTTLTALPAGFVSGTWDTVYYRANVSLTAAGGTWLDFVLDHPHAYNNTRSLVIQIEQCAASGATTNVFSLQHSTTGVNRRIYSAGGCPFAYGGASLYVVNCGINVAPPSTGPNYLHYKFENNPAPLSILNCAAPGVGTSVASMTGLTLTPGGQFDSCITGAGVSGSGVVTGWNNNLGTSSWTISFWADFPSTSVFGYVFGDGGGSFRCFNNGAAPAGGITLRGTGITNVDVTGLSAGPMVIHFVYDSALANIKVYKNGVLAQTVGQTPLNLTAGTGFKVGGYTTSAGFTGKMDEFRLYRRALDSNEVGATWNQDLACGVLVPVIINNNEVPKTYSLQQNYPNPFNPVTSIRFSLPKADIVKLKVFDALGREVELLVNEQVNAGTHEIKFDASKLSSGIYFYTIKTPNFTETKKMMLIK
jgi:hypothetical protein